MMKKDEVIEKKRYDDDSIFTFMGMTPTYTVVDFLSYMNNDQFPMLKNICLMLMNITPTTVRVESFFSTMKHAYRPNLREGGIEQRVLFNLRRSEHTLIFNKTK